VVPHPPPDSYFTDRGKVDHRQDKEKYEGTPLEQPSKVDQYPSIDRFDHDHKGIIINDAIGDSDY